MVLIIGDFTARVGDPSGRSAERPVLSREEIDANAETFQEQAFKVLDRERTEVRFNSEWLRRWRARSCSASCAASRSPACSSATTSPSGWRAAEPISVLELLYPVLQGYDSVAIEADVELGGTDQKFNLLFGARRPGRVRQAARSRS